MDFKENLQEMLIMGRLFGFSDVLDSGGTFDLPKIKLKQLCYITLYYYCLYTVYTTPYYRFK